MSKNAIFLEVTAANLCQIHHSLFSTRANMRTPKAQAFLLVHAEGLTAELHKTIRDFLERKLA
jgi:hypothetical protein